MLRSGEANTVETSTLRTSTNCKTFRFHSEVSYSRVNNDGICMACRSIKKSGNGNKWKCSNQQYKRAKHNVDSGHYEGDLKKNY